MCGRATLTVSAEELAETFGLTEVPSLAPRYNLAPSQPLATLKRGAGRVLQELRWGLLVGDDPRPRVNVRTESASAPQYREAFAERRCAVLVDGFYEWRRVGEAKRPFWIHREDGRAFALGGLSQAGSCAVLTTRAAGVVAELHDRMPVIVPTTLLEHFLEGTRDEARALCVSNPEALVAREVSALVNSPRNDGPELLGPPSLPRQGSLF